jgi:NTE family protein
MSARILACLLLCSAPCFCLAQDEPVPPSPQSKVQPVPARQLASKTRATVGVALEGGGALGEAHIGVLKWFEDHHIPIDYLAGTSMGGLVGGLYASGKSADDIHEVVKTADWPLLLGGATPYQDLSFRRKEDARQIPNSIIIGLKHGPRLPPGLNTGQQVNLLIDRETLPYSSIKSFDDLPIPFRCVSTELISGKAYVFQNGSLSDAMRATISIPGVCAPVRRDNQIFVDGGLVDNLPTDVVRKMGADVVVAIHLQISPASAKEIQSAFGVLGRSVELVIAETEIRGMSGADIIVKANVEKFTTMEYEKSDELVKVGYAAAEEKAAILKPYALDDAAWAAYLADKQSRIRTQVGTPQFVKVVGLEGEATQNVQKFLAGLAGKPIEQKDLEQLLTRLTGVGRYDSVTYEMITDDSGRPGLLILIHEKTYAPPTLQPAFEVNGAQAEDVTFTLGGRVTFMDVAGFRSEWRTDIQFGGTYGIASDLYRPFQPMGKWFFDPFINANQTTFSIYNHQNPKAIYRLDQAYGGIDVGYGISRFSEARFGYQIGYESATLRLGAPDFGSFSGRVGAVRARYVLDHSNDPVIPTQGYYVQSNFYYYDAFAGSFQPFTTLEATVQYYQPLLHHRDSIFIVADGGSTLGYKAYGVPAFFLGGVNHLSAYGLNELFGNQYFLGRVGYLRRIATLPPFVGKNVYFTVYGEVGKMYGDPFGAPKLSGDGALGVIAQTAFGPVFIGAAAGDTGHYKWFFQLGRVF